MHPNTNNTKNHYLFNSDFRSSMNFDCFLDLLQRIAHQFLERIFGRHSESDERCHKPIRDGTAKKGVGKKDLSFGMRGLAESRKQIDLACYWSFDFVK
jgi:hypothetical protein